MRALAHCSPTYGSTFHLGGSLADFGTPVLRRAAVADVEAPTTGYATYGPQRVAGRVTRQDPRAGGIPERLSHGALGSDVSPGWGFGIGAVVLALGWLLATEAPRRRNPSRPKRNRARRVVFRVGVRSGRSSHTTYGRRGFGRRRRRYFEQHLKGD